MLSWFEENIWFVIYEGQAIDILN